MAAPRVIKIQYEVNNSEIKASVDLWRQVARELGHSEEEADALANELNRAGDEARRSGKAINQTANDARKAGASLTTLAKQVAGVLSVAALAAAGKEIVKQAGRIEAVANKVSSVFGTAASQINAFAEASVDSLGMSADSIRELAAETGDLLKPMGFAEDQVASMSIELVKLSAALSANTAGKISSAEASTIVTKAMLGERDGLVSLGIKISEADVQQRLLEKGQKNLTGAMLQQAKALATQELIFESSESAIQNYAENTNTLNRTLDAMGAKLSDAANALIERFTPQIKTAIEFVGGMVDTVLEWAGATSKTTNAYDKQLISLKKEQTQLNTLAPLLLDSNVKAEQKEVIMGKIQKIYPGFLANIDLNKVRESDLKTALKAANDEYERRGQIILLQKAQAQIEEENAGASIAGANALIQLQEVIQNQLGGWKAYQGIRREVNAESADFQKNLILFTDKLKDSNLSITEQVWQLGRFVERYKEAKPELVANNKFISDQVAHVSSLIRVYNLSGDSLEKMTEKQAQLGIAMENLGIKTEELSGANFELASTSNAVSDAQKKRSEELAKARAKAAEAAREELESLSAIRIASVQSADVTEKAIRDVEGTLLDSLDSIMDATNDRTGLNLMEQLGFTQEHVNSAVALADGLFSTIASLSQAYGAQETARLDEQMRRELERNDQTTKNEEQRAKNREKIEERFAKRKAAIDRDIAEQERRYAIFQAIINTAQAVTKALATFPPPISYIQAGIAGASGLAQVRLIEAQAFADGGEVKGGTPGKDSVPAMLMPNEFVMTVDNMRKHGDLIRAIHKDRLPEYFGQNTTYHVNENGQLVAEMKALQKVIKAKREVTFRGEVFEKALFERRGRTEYLNRKYSSRK